MNRDIESGEPEAAAPAASGDKAMVRDKEYKLRTTEENQQVLEAASRTRPLLNALQLPFQAVRGGGVQFVGKLGDIAVAALTKTASA